MSGKAGDNTARASGVIAGVAGGLSVGDQWRITADKTMTGGGDDFTANWEQVDTTGQGYIAGAVMTESSGIFTFPETGIYTVSMQGCLYTGVDATGSIRLGLKIQGTTNDSSYVIWAQGDDWNPSNQFNFMTNTVSTMVDVTDTSQVKVKFTCVNGGSNNPSRVWEGDSAENRTYATFVKLGGT